MLLSFIDIIKIITVFQIFFVSIFLFLNTKNNSKRNYLLVTFILAKAFFLCDWILMDHYKIVFPFVSNIILIGSSFQWLLGPALFYTIIVTTNKDYIFKYKHLLNLVPFLFHLGFIISQFHVYGYETKLLLLESGFPYNTAWNRIFFTANYFQFFIYAALALKILSNAREEMYRTSSQSIERNIFYLKFLIYDFMSIWGMNTIAQYLPMNYTAYIILWTITIFNLFFIANAIVYQGLKFPEIFREETAGKQKYEKNLLAEKEKELYARKLQEYMEEQKPYLNPALSLSDLASELAIPTHLLSQVLNISMKQNFYDFVNNYRIEESKRLLAGIPDNNRTILEILYQSGFNSKSVFNASFKKYTGITPRDFKKNLQSLHQNNTSVAVS